MMSEERLVSFWESTLSPDIPEAIVKEWRLHELSAIKRGEILVDYLKAFVNLSGCRVLDRDVVMAVYRLLSPW
jgi:hypothetical protein